MSISRKTGVSTRSSSLLAALCPLALLGLAYGCASAGDADPMPSFGDNRGPSGPSVNGAAGNASATPTATPSNTPSNANNTTNSNVQTGSNSNTDGQVPTNLPQTNGAAGSNAGTNNNSGTQGSAGTQGSGGTNTQGSAGTSGMMAGNAGSASMPPPTGAAGTSGTTTPPPPTTPDITCPTGATFCSGFESAALPSVASFQSNPVVQLEFDPAMHHSGSQSIVFHATTGGFNIREVVVPIPGQAFWARLFIQTSNAFGDNDHDSLFVGSTATPDKDNNAEDGVEFSEQGNQVLLNSNDALYSAKGPGFPQGDGPQLSAGTWHCVEAFFDGGSGNVQIFSDGTQLIDAPGYKKLTYQTFRFGYVEFNTARTIWFDDVVVAPNRVGCQ